MNIRDVARSEWAICKKRKMECEICLDVINKESFTKHVETCALSQKLIKNEKTCSVCEKTFQTKLAVRQHIGIKHEALMAAQKWSFHNQPQKHKKTTRICQNEAIKTLVNKPITMSVNTIFTYPYMLWIHFVAILWKDHIWVTMKLIMSTCV